MIIVLAFVFTDVEVVVLIAVVLIAIYIVGSYWKHRTLTGYARWFEENLTSKGKVKYASHGHAGLRIKCEPLDKGGLFREIHFALSLGARENLVYYPLAPLNLNPDRINCWVILQKTIQSDLRIVRQSEKKAISSFQENPRLTDLKLEALEELGYVAYASDRTAAMEIISKAAIPSNLKPMRIESIQIDKPSSVLRVIAALRRDSLDGVVNFMFSLANSV